MGCHPSLKTSLCLLTPEPCSQLQGGGQLCSLQSLCCPRSRSLAAKLGAAAWSCRKRWADEGWGYILPSKQLLQLLSLCSRFLAKQVTHRLLQVWGMLSPPDIVRTGMPNPTYTQGLDTGTQISTGNMGRVKKLQPDCFPPRKVILLQGDVLQEGIKGIFSGIIPS